ncbi:hypothetical protein Bbelb_230720 [Branchiostoma belcheri]|nr:hypothetical protein Bbelb_230720 [Branchiostoma belcheri]
MFEHTITQRHIKTTTSHKHRTAGSGNVSATAAAGHRVGAYIPPVSLATVHGPHTHAGLHSSCPPSLSTGRIPDVSNPSQPHHHIPKTFIPSSKTVGKNYRASHSHHHSLASPHPANNSLYPRNAFNRQNVYRVSVYLTRWMAGAMAARGVHNRPRPRYKNNPKICFSLRTLLLASPYLSNTFTTLPEIECSSPHFGGDAGRSVCRRWKTA